MIFLTSGGHEVTHQGLSCLLCLKNVLVLSPAAPAPLSPTWKGFHPASATLYDRYLLMHTQLIKKIQKTNTCWLTQRKHETTWQWSKVFHTWGNFHNRFCKGNFHRNRTCFHGLQKTNNTIVVLEIKQIKQTQVRHFSKNIAGGKNRGA